MSNPMTEPRGYRMLAAELHQQIYEGDTVAEAAVREIRHLREDNERLKAEIVETLAKIESRWKEDEKKYERARELLSLCIEDGVGYLQLQNDIRALLDGEEK